MNRFAVIGLGHFGAVAARTLFEKEKEVIAIDINKDAVQDASEYSAQAIVADATDKKTLEEIGITEVDAAIVSLGERMDIITLVALYLKELNVPHVVVKALSADHAKILEAIGVNEIIHPEAESAARLGTRLSLNNATHFIPLISEYSIVAVRSCVSLSGKKIAELETKDIQIIAIQCYDDKQLNIDPQDDDEIQQNDVLILMGKNTVLAQFTSVLRDE